MGVGDAGVVEARHVEVDAFGVSHVFAIRIEDVLGGLRTVTVELIVFASTIAYTA